MTDMPHGSDISDPTLQRAVQLYPKAIRTLESLRRAEGDLEALQWMRDQLTKAMLSLSDDECWIIELRHKGIKVKGVLEKQGWHKIQKITGYAERQPYKIYSKALNKMILSISYKDRSKTQ